MGNLSVAELARSWYREAEPSRSGDPAGNSLFRMLYNAWCRRTGTAGDFDTLSDHHQACTRLYSWYASRYGTQLPKGSRGLKRTDGGDDSSYTFDRLYCDDRQFRNYLETGLPQHGSQDLLAFVMHTAVAFLVPPGELDTVLQALGFHPLHVKNLHHLAIAYVLLTAEPGVPDPGCNPFAQVKALYFKALRILEDPGAPAGDAYSYADLETKMIRSMLMQGRGLAAQNFEALVARNRTALNMRHSLILSDFHRLSAVFIHIFDSSAEPDAFTLDEAHYSFYRFVKNFCQDDLTRKHFREHLTAMIDRRQKHPTRNLMILLWLYTYCFAFLPGVCIEENTFRRIAKQLKKTDPAWEEEIRLYYQDSLLDVYGFLTGQPARGVPGTFRGADFFTFINETLLLRYGWGPLNDKLPFDHYIHRLKDLTIRTDPFGGGSAAYDCRALADTAAAVDNVPFPLVVLTGIFGSLARLHGEKAAQYKYAKLSSCPLKCSLYEQL